MSLRKRFIKDDSATLRSIRALGEAFAFVRHVTDMGEAEFVARVDGALARLSPAQPVVDPSAGNVETGKKKGEKDDMKVDASSGAGPLAAVEGGSRRSRRRRRQQSARVHGVPVLGEVEDIADEFADLISSRTGGCGGGGGGVGGGLLQIAASAARDVSPAISVTSKPNVESKRTLQARRSGSRSPRGQAPTVDSAGSSCSVHFAVGTKVIIGHLGSRPELRGCDASVLSWCGDSQRYAVCISGSGEKVKIRSDVLKKSIFG